MERCLSFQRLHLSNSSSLTSQVPGKSPLCCGGHNTTKASNRSTVSPSTNSDHFKHTPSKNKLKAAQTLTIALFLLSFGFISRIYGSVLPHARRLSGSLQLSDAFSFSMFQPHQGPRLLRPWSLSEIRSTKF